MSDDGPRAGLLTTRADKKERRNEKVRRAQKTKRTFVLVFLRKETVVVVGRATGTNREVDNENIFWLKLLFCDEAERRKKWKKWKISQTLTNRFSFSYAMKSFDDDVWILFSLCLSLKRKQFSPHFDARFGGILTFNARI
jgi:hypothetical protein